MWQSRVKSETVTERAAANCQTVVRRQGGEGEAASTLGGARGRYAISTRILVKIWTLLAAVFG